MRLNVLYITTSLACLVLVQPKPASADSKAPFPQLSGDMVVELQNEHGVESSSDTNHRNNLFLRTEVAPELRFNNRFYIDGVAELEPVNDPDPGKDAWFEQTGIFIEEIKLNYELGQWSVKAGKYNPDFGIAWDFGRGIFGEDFAEDYEITEKIGFGGAYNIETSGHGSHEITASTFFTDTTFLAESIGTGRGTVSKSDGGASNTENFSSFAISLNGVDIGGIKNLYYKVGYRHLGEDDIGGETETGWALTLGHRYDLIPNLNGDILVEYADISNFEGGANDNSYFTASLVTTMYENWNITAAYTARDIQVPGDRDLNDYLFQLTGGYDFQNGLTLEGGWKTTRESEEEDNILGLLARYTFSF